MRLVFKVSSNTDQVSTHFEKEAYVSPKYDTQWVMMSTPSSHTLKSARKEWKYYNIIGWRWDKK